MGILWKWKLPSIHPGIPSSLCLAHRCSGNVYGLDNFFHRFERTVPKHSRWETELEGVGELVVVRGRQQQMSLCAPDCEREEDKLEIEQCLAPGNRSVPVQQRHPFVMVYNAGREFIKAWR